MRSLFQQQKIIACLELPCYYRSYTRFEKRVKDPSFDREKDEGNELLPIPHDLFHAYS